MERREGRIGQYRACWRVWRVGRTRFVAGNRRNMSLGLGLFVRIITRHVDPVGTKNARALVDPLVILLLVFILRYFGGFVMQMQNGEKLNMKGTVYNA